MPNDVRLPNLTADSHKDWEVRSLAAMSMHGTAGYVAHLFEFRRTGTAALHRFVFAGLGLGGGAIVGSSVPFVNPLSFAWDTARLLGSAFWETGRALSGGDLREIKQPDWQSKIEAFTPIHCETPFSAIDLHRSAGRLSTLAASFSIGYGSTVITAFDRSRTFFSSQSLTGGQAGGVGGGGSINFGLWLKVS